MRKRRNPLSTVFACIFSLHTVYLAYEIIRRGMNMISNSVANYYRKKELLPEQTIVCMEYAMQALENELSKFVMFAIAFGVAGLLTKFFLTYVISVSCIRNLLV